MTNIEHLINAELPLLVDFYAEWCSPCKEIEPQIDALAERLTGRVNVFKADVEKYMKDALKYEVRGVPTFILFKNGQIIWREAGILSNSQLEEIIAEYVG